MAQPDGTLVRTADRQETAVQRRRSIQALERDIRDWIAHWNENPKPFTWTKTADEIGERLI
jgi:hypothetical protein